MSDLEETHKAQATKPGSWLVAVLGAVGGALLALGGQVALELFKGERAERREVTKQNEATAAQRSARAERFYNDYGELGDLPRRASAFAGGGREGNADEVRTVARHFRELSSEILLGRVDKGEVAGFYGGRLAVWARQFRNLGQGGPNADRFDPGEREVFGLLAAALADLAAAATAADQLDPHAGLSAVNAASNGSGD